VMTRAGMSFPRRVRGEHIGRVVGAIRNGAKRTHGLSCINVLRRMTSAQFKFQEFFRERYKAKDVQDTLCSFESRERSTHMTLM
jgi:hypothetical protein